MCVCLRATRDRLIAFSSSYLLLLLPLMPTSPFPLGHPHPALYLPPCLSPITLLPGGFPLSSPPPPYLALTPTTAHPYLLPFSSVAPYQIPLSPPLPLICSSPRPHALLFSVFLIETHSKQQKLIDLQLRL